MKNIRSKYVKDSLLDYEKLTNTLKENTSSAVKDLLGEAVRDTYRKILSESDENDYDEEEVDDTDSNESNDSNKTQKSSNSSSFDKNGNYNGGKKEMEEDDDETEETTTEVTPDGGVEKTTTGSDSEGNEWSQFEKYKVSDDKYDFSDAQDDEIVKAYKLMKDEDQLIVTKDGDMVHLQDNETGADYIIDLGSVPEEDEATDLNDGSDAVDVDYDDEESDFEDGDDFEDNDLEDDDFENDDDFEDDSFEDDTDDFDDSEEDDFNDNDEDKFMNEERIFEIALNEYNSNVGYTDNYQKKDVMTNPGMSEPAKSSSTNDWDKGIPHGTEKPWSKQKKSVGPFNGEKGKTVEEEFELECGDVESPEANLEEKMLIGGAVQQHTTTRSDIPSGRKDYGPTRMKRSVHTAQDGQVNGTATAKNESIMKKANAIFEENKQLKKALKEFRNTLSEAAVTNVNLGQIIKLISENTTSADEKKEIISRFGKEAKTIDASKSLYESISNDLKKKGKMNINEDKQFTANSSKMINETQIYKSKDLMESLGMMHRLCKL